MADECLSSADIVRALGGPTALARALSAGRSAVANWTFHGIPARYWPQISRLAIDIDGAKHITIEVLEKHVPGGRMASGEAA